MKLTKYATLKELVESNMPEWTKGHGFFHYQILYMTIKSYNDVFRISEADLIAKLQNLEHRHETLLPDGENEYLEIVNPFTQKEWIYVTYLGCAWPIIPTYVYDSSGKIKRS